MLQLTVDWFVYSLLRLDPASRWAQAVNFFFYDSLKILLLLAGLITLIGFLRTYLPQQKIRKWLSGDRVVAHIAASLFGAVTPFCSCSSIPLFISFLEAGVPLGVTFSFLITSPLINEYLVVLMLGFFGWKIALLYCISGMALGVFSGLVLGKMNLEKYLEKDLLPQNGADIRDVKHKDVRERFLFGVTEARTIISKLWAWVLVGVGLGAFIHNYVPQGSVELIVAKAGIFSVPIATLLGVPMYGGCAAIVPVAVVLFQKGFPLGTALAFMMAVAALSLPEAIMLRRAMNLRLIAIFFGVTTAGIILTGYLFNFLQKALV